MHNRHIPDAKDFGKKSELLARGHALVPILLGLLGPVAVLSFIDIYALANASAIVHIYLFAIFALAAGAYILSVLEPGEIIRVTMDQKARVVELERIGLLARSVMQIPFANITSVRVDVHTDKDGYETAVPVIVLSTHNVLALPAGTTEADVVTMRDMLTS